MIDLTPIETGATFEDVMDGLAYEALTILYDRQRKYGPDNIRQQGLFGILTRIKDDKISRVKRALNGKIVNGEVVLDPIEDGDAEDTFEDGLFDLANYALIMIAVKRGVWGKPMRADTKEVEALAKGGVPQLQEDGSVEFSPERTRRVFGVTEDEFWAEEERIKRMIAEQLLETLPPLDYSPLGVRRSLIGTQLLPPFILEEWQEQALGPQPLSDDILRDMDETNNDPALD